MNLMSEDVFNSLDLSLVSELDVYEYVRDGIWSTEYFERWVDYVRREE